MSHFSNDLFSVAATDAVIFRAGAPKAVDLFAGAGGFTEGATQAGAVVVWAANHWADAVQVHTDNHPEVAHACQDLQQANWDEVPAHDLLLASPACQGHSKARGKDRAHHDATRSTAWAVVSALEHHRPEAAIVENVAEFMRWVLFPAWCGAVRALGYAISPHHLDAADFGVPQHRERVFLLLTKSEAPLSLRLEQQAHVPISTVLDFSAGSWSMIDKQGRASATLERVKRGRQTFGDRFVMPYYGNGSGLTGRAIDRPIGTITTKDRWALVDGNRMRMMSKDEVRGGMGFRASYRLPTNRRRAIHMLGNAVCPAVPRAMITALTAQV